MVFISTSKPGTGSIDDTCWKFHQLARFLDMCNVTNFLGKTLAREGLQAITGMGKYSSGNCW